MILDYHFDFADNQVLAGNADQVSTNVLDAGSAKKMFAGSPGKFKIGVHVKTVGGTTPNIRARFVGADNAALTSNPVILADTGQSRALVAADLPQVYELVPGNQKDAKQFYGVIWLQTGNADNSGTVSAQGAEAVQNQNIK